MHIPVALGTVLFLASEMMFFAALFAAYYDLRANRPQWPPPGVHLDVAEATVVELRRLSSSSVVMSNT